MLGLLEQIALVADQHALDAGAMLHQIIEHRPGHGVERLGPREVEGEHAQIAPESKTLSVRSQENEQRDELVVPERVLDGPQLVQQVRAQQKRQSVATRDGHLAVQSRWLLELVK